MSQLHEHREEIFNAIRTFTEKGNKVDLHTVVIFWYNGHAMNEICHREAWFDEYIEAELWAAEIFKEEVSLGFETICYIDGSMQKVNSVYENKITAESL